MEFLHMGIIIITIDLSPWKMVPPMAAGVNPPCNCYSLLSSSGGAAPTSMASAAFRSGEGELRVSFECRSEASTWSSSSLPSPEKAYLMDGGGQRVDSSSRERRRIRGGGRILPHCILRGRPKSADDAEERERQNMPEGENYPCILPPLIVHVR